MTYFLVFGLAATQASTDLSNNSSDPTWFFINLGVLGAIFILMLWKKLVPGWVYDEAVSENKALREANDTLNKNAQERGERFALTTAKNTEALEKVLPLLELLRQERFPPPSRT